MAQQQRAHSAGFKRPRDGGSDGGDCTVCRSCAWDAVAEAVAEWEPTRRGEPNNHHVNGMDRLAALGNALQRCTAAFVEVAKRTREEEQKVPTTASIDEAWEPPSDFLLSAAFYCSKADMRVRGPEWDSCFSASEPQPFTLYTLSNVFLAILEEMLFWHTLTANRPPVASEPLCRCGGGVGKSISPEAALAALEGLLAAEVSAAAEVLSTVGSECAELATRRRHAVYLTMEMCLSLSVSPSLYLHWGLRPFNAVADALSAFLRQGAVCHPSSLAGAAKSRRNAPPTRHLQPFGWNPLAKLTAAFKFAGLPRDDLTLVLSPLSSRFKCAGGASAIAADDRHRQRAEALAATEAASRSEHDANDGVRTLSEAFGVGKSFATPYAGVAAAAAAAVDAQRGVSAVKFENSNEEADASDGEEYMAAVDVEPMPLWGDGAVPHVRRLVEGRPRGSYGADARRVVAAMRALCPHLLVPYLLDLPMQQELIFYTLCAIGGCEEALTGFPSSGDAAWPKPPLGLLSNGRRSCRQRCACGCGNFFKNDLKDVPPRWGIAYFMTKKAHLYDPRGASLVLDAYLCAEPFLPPPPLSGGEHPLRLALSKMRTHSSVVWRFIRSLVAREAVAAVVLHQPVPWASRSQSTPFSTSVSDEAMEAARRRLIAAASEPAPWMKEVSGASLVPPLEPAGSDPPTLLWLYVAQFGFLCRHSMRGDLYDDGFDSDWFTTSHGPAAASHVSHALRIISFLAAPGGCDPNAVTGVDGAFTSPASTALGTACKWLLPSSVIARLLAVGADPNRLFYLGRRNNKLTYAYPLETYIREAGVGGSRYWEKHRESAAIAAQDAPVTLRRLPFWFGTPFTPPPSALGVSVPPFAPGYDPSPQDEFVREYVEVVEAFIAAGSWLEALPESVFLGQTDADEFLRHDRGYSASSEDTEWSSDSEQEGTDEDSWLDSSTDEDDSLSTSLSSASSSSSSSTGSLSHESLPYAADQPLLVQQSGVRPRRRARDEFLFLLLVQAPTRVLLHLFSAERRRVLFDNFVELGGCGMCSPLEFFHTLEMYADRQFEDFNDFTDFDEGSDESLAAVISSFRSAESEAYASVTSNRPRRRGSALIYCDCLSQGSSLVPKKLPQSLLTFAVRNGLPAATSALLRMGVGCPYSLEVEHPHAAVAYSLLKCVRSIDYFAASQMSGVIAQGLRCLKALVDEGGYSPVMLYWCLLIIQREYVEGEHLKERVLSNIEKVALEAAGPKSVAADLSVHPFSYSRMRANVRAFWKSSSFLSRRDQLTHREVLSYSV